MAGAPTGEICDYLHSIRTKPADVPFFQETKEEHFSRLNCQKILHDDPGISFSEFCRKAVTEQAWKVGFPLYKGQWNSGALHNISLLNRVLDHFAADDRWAFLRMQIFLPRARSWAQGCERCDGEGF